MLYQLHMEQKKIRQTVLFQMYLTPSLARRLKKRAKFEALAMSAWVRQVITFELDKPSRRELDTPSPREQAGRECPAKQA
jgi:hypothetical protein